MFLILLIIILINSIISSTTVIQSINEKTSLDIVKTENDLKIDEEQLRIDRKMFQGNEKELEKSIKNYDVIRLNVGGEFLMTTRETLTSVPKSILSLIFNGRWERKLQKDQNGNIFLDFNPIVFRHLLNQLQLFDKNNLNNIFLPTERSLVLPFKKMIQKLGLDHLLSLEKNIINWNIGGHIITNRRRTFPQVSNSTFDILISSSKIINLDDKSDVFMDYNPKLFRHLIDQLRKESSKTKFDLKPSSNREKISFQNLVDDLTIYEELDSSMNINTSAKWRQNGVTLAGGNGQGDQLNQLDRPHGIYLDDNQQYIYIADSYNHRILQWRYDANNGQIVAGGNGKGNRMNQLNQPTDVWVDKQNDSLIICDHGNRRVIRWLRRNNANGQIIISDIDCYGLTMDNNEDLYVSDWKKNEVKRWKMGDQNGTIVAGGNGTGNNLDQLNGPRFIFVDQDYSLYITDRDNHRVMKWMKGAKEGIVVAGGNGPGNNLTQLNHPQGVIVDHWDNVYVTDSHNDRVMCWLKGSKTGSIVGGEGGKGKQSNHFNGLRNILIDRQGNLCVADYYNHRIQKFIINFN